MQVMRGAKRKGVRYFGPYAHAWAIRETARPAAAGLPGAHLLSRRLQARRPDRPALPARLHRQVLGALRRPGQRRGAPARSPRTSATSWPARPARSSAGSSSEMRTAADEHGVRAGRPAARRHRGAAAGDGEERGRARRRHRRRRDRASPRTSSRPPSRSSTSAAAGSAASAAGSSTRSRTSTTGDLVEQLLQQLYGERDAATPVPARGPGARRCPSRRRAGRRVADRAAAARRVDLRVPQRGDKRALMETVAAQRAAGAGAAQDQARLRPDHPRAARWRRCRRPSAWTRRRCASSASTSRTCRAPTSSPRWSSSRTGCRARASTAASRSDVGVDGPGRRPRPCTR